MNKLLYLFGYIFLILIALSGCTGEKSNETSSVKDVSSLKLFSKVSKNETGITFINQIPERTFLNFLTYEYLYNGSGVSTGDLNGDGLPDILFISTLGENELYLNTGNLKFKNIERIAD